MLHHLAHKRGHLDTRANAGLPTLPAGDCHAMLERLRIMSADLASDAVFQRRDDFSSGCVVFRIRGKHQHHIQRQAHRIAFDLHIAFLHDVEQADLHFAGEIRKFIDRKDAAVRPRQQAVVDVSSFEMSCPLLAALIGSMSPIMSAIVTSGVASFSTYRSSDFSHAIGVSSPGCRSGRGIACRWAAADGHVSRNRATYGITGSSNIGQQARHPSLCLPAKSQQDEIVA